MTNVRLNPLDAAWLLTESRATPNHVGGLLQFRLPEGAPRDFMRRLMTEFRAHRVFVAPWNRRLKYAFSMNPVPAWVEDDDIDLEFHVRHSALPWPGGERELGELIGRLQSAPLDLTRPPWECTIIEGLEGNRFALFIKMHHSLIDGVSGMKLLQRAMSADRARSVGMPPFWAARPESGARAEPAAPAPTFTQALSTAAQALRGQVQTVPQLLAAFGKMLKRVRDPHADGMVLPFAAPSSVLNGRVRAKRRFATQQFPIERMRALAKAADGTLNDVVLAICGGALRSFLQERDSLPERSLTAGIPVSVRPKDDEGSGNAITFILATLGTDIADAAERLSAIRSSVRHAKEHVQSLPKHAMEQYTMLLMAPTMAGMLTGVGGRTRPMFNITVSNLPGPDKPLYFRGAELVATYPASIVTHGQALNITCQSYAGWMDFGITGCHATLPSMQRVAVHMADAIAELEAAFLPRATPAPVPRRSRSKPEAPSVEALPTKRSRSTIAKTKAAGVATAAHASKRTASRPRARQLSKA
jgi:WS/DGAT/MGAT family acyltransferase